MKNFLVVAITVALGYLTYDALQPAPPPPPVVRVAAAVPTPAPPKLYFHSALDAPPMSTRTSSGTSYFSTDPNSGFRGYYSSGLGNTYWNSGSTYIIAPSTGASAVGSRTIVSPYASETSHVQQGPGHGYTREREFPNAPPVGVAR